MSGAEAKPILRTLLGWSALLALVWFSWLMLRITLQYIPIRDDAAFLRIKQEYLPVTHWKVAFFVHVFTSMFALCAGFTQFSPGLLRRWPALHRWVGKLYIADVILVTGPASFIMAIYANGGFPSKLAFALLASLWIGCTAAGYRAIRRREFAAHRRWMIRSYALTLSALTLRAWKVALVWTLAPPPVDLYRAVAWLGWVPNLLLAEWIVRRFLAPARSFIPKKT